MFFTQEDFRKIEEYLKHKGKKDSDFDTVSSVTHDDTVVIVQDNKNKAININTFIREGMQPKSITTDKLSDEITNRLQRMETEIEAIKAGNVPIDILPHVVLTQAQYDALVAKDPNTLYIIVESLTPEWVFGDSFPIILA